MIRRWLLTAVFTLAGAVLAGTAGDGLALARAQLERLDFNAASRAARAALKAGGADPSELEALHGLLAQTAAALGEGTLAEREFRTVLALDPTFVLGKGVSPRVRAPFDAARRSAPAALTVSVESESAGEHAVSTRIAAGSDVLGLARSSRLYTQENGRFVPRELAGPLPSTLTWTCAAAPCSHFVSLLDVSGNELLRRGSPLAAMVVVGTGRPAPAKRWVRAGTVLTALSVLAAAGAVTFGLGYAARDRSLRETAHGDITFAAARKLEDARQRDYGLMLGSAGVCAGGGALAILTW